MRLENKTKQELIELIKTTNKQRNKARQKVKKMRAHRRADDKAFFDLSLIGIQLGEKYLNLQAENFRNEKYIVSQNEEIQTLKNTIEKEREEKTIFEREALDSLDSNKKLKHISKYMIDQM